jgi:hypothetical protein
MFQVKFSYFICLSIILFACKESKIDNNQKINEVSKLLITVFYENDVKKGFSKLEIEGFVDTLIVQGLINIIDYDTTYCSMNYSVLADPRVSTIPCYEVPIGIGAIYILDQFRKSKNFSVIDLNIHQLPLSKLRYFSKHELTNQKLRYLKKFKNYYKN